MAWIYQVNNASQWSETMAYSESGAKVYRQTLVKEAEQVLFGLELSPVAGMFFSLPAIACNLICLLQ